MPAEKTNLQKTIEILALRAQVAAVNAWTVLDKSGVMGNVALPSDPLDRKKFGQIWKAGYAMALADYVMSSVEEMKAASDKDQAEGAEKIGRLLM